MAITPRWGCTRCGMVSTRRDSVDRHVKYQHPAGDAARVKFAELIAGIQSGKYGVRSKPTFGKTTVQTALDTFIKGYWEEKGKLAAHDKDHTVPVPSRSTSTNLRQDSFLESSFSKNAQPHRIFGFQFFICEHCLQQKYKIVSWSKGNNTRLETPAQPCNDILLSNPEIARNKVNYLQTERAKLPAYLARFIREQFHTPILVGQLLESSATTVTIRNPFGTSFSVTFPKSVELEKPVYHTGSLREVNWATGIVTKGVALLQDHDIEELAAILQDSTYGIVRITHLSEIKVPEFNNAYWPVVGEYFVYIADASDYLTVLSALS